MAELAGKHVVLGLTGGVACYKSAALCRELTRAGASVQVVMTDSAREFIGETTMQALSGRPVATSLWDASVPNAMPHINLSRDADVMIVAPATAHFIAKLAHGLADDLLSTLCVGRTCDLLIAPAMNVEMWTNPVTQRNLRTVLADGVVVLGPAAGEQACGETGLGRMLEPEELLAAIIAHLQPKLLLGKHVLITAGPTYEPIDPVRGLTNLSSGRMGYAVAQAAADAGARVTLVSGPTALETPRGVQRMDVRTAREMHAAVMQRVNECDVFIAVAAVADWRIAAPSSTKLKKLNGSPTLALEPNPDILADVAARPNAPYCVGFAAESDNLEQHAVAKRAAKGIPLLVANIGPATFGHDDNELLLVDAKGSTHWPRATKHSLARRLVAEIAQRLG
ncbi:MAG TPA: bifunctional phosphopantothenoylcysteine decarboxylase/phosphopantothenate--cysteine ligase CoaBC [Burkholderiaceae bacterium]|nr:bifunctional phosphopantothenoylcysteine decarboxylase/phosphopantothenate--cysteine ligase CoaBC [Burkholderiaceae bacterium]